MAKGQPIGLALPQGQGNRRRLDPGRREIKVGRLDNQVVGPSVRVRIIDRDLAKAAASRVVTFTASPVTGVSARAVKGNMSMRPAAPAAVPVAAPAPMVVNM